MLEIKNFSKIYPNGKVGVSDANLKVESGDIFAFIGPNGAGKTTTIKCIVGINDISEGDIVVDGVSITVNPIKVKSMIAYIPDNPDIYPNLTGIQYINMIADIFKVDKTKRKELIQKYADMLEISGDLNTPISNYSHGMRQKICIMSALIHRPKLWLLDEPLTGLDPQTALALRQYMDYYKKQGNTVLYSSHNLDAVEKTCDRAYIINHGKMVSEFTIEDFKRDNPGKSLEEVFVEQFYE